MDGLLKQKEPDFSWNNTGAYFCESLWGYREIERKAIAMAADMPHRVQTQTMSGEGYSGSEAAGGVRIMFDGKTQEVFKPQQ